MNLSASNIAWDRGSDEAVYALLAKYGFTGLDVTPSAFAAPGHLKVAGMQSLLFGHPELKIFESESVREQTREHLAGILAHAQKLGVTACVFGSPVNRCMNGPSEEKLAIARTFFTALAHRAEEASLALCLEPNPAAYGTDFLTRTEEAFEFVKSINLPGLRVNLDTGTMIMNAENPRELIEKYGEFIGHVHLSAPNLGALEPHSVYAETIAALKKADYQKWVSIEMRRPEQNELENLEQALSYVRSIAQDIA